jgi:hypothetical protein
MVVNYSRATGRHRVGDGAPCAAEPAGPADAPACATGQALSLPGTVLPFSMDGAPGEPPPAVAEADYDIAPEEERVAHACAPASPAAAAVAACVAEARAAWAARAWAPADPAWALGCELRARLGFSVRLRRGRSNKSYLTRPRHSFLVVRVAASSGGAAEQQPGPPARTPRGRAPLKFRAVCRCLPPAWPAWARAARACSRTASMHASARARAPAPRDHAPSLRRPPHPTPMQARRPPPPSTFMWTQTFVMPSAPPKAALGEARRRRPLAAPAAAARMRNSPPLRLTALDQSDLHCLPSACVPRYDTLLAALPQDFVGSIDALTLVASIMAAASRQLFLQLGLPLPPWREPRAVLARWVGGGPGAAFEDVPVPLLPTPEQVRAGKLAGPPQLGLLLLEPLPPPPPPPPPQLPLPLPLPAS